MGGATTRPDASAIHAHATLRRGALFLCAGRPGDPVAGERLAGPHRARLLGNQLRELDRFLNILIDEVASSRGIATRTGERNTANKLARFKGALALDDADHARLSALGRMRECLFHCRGRVGRGTAGLTTGWPGNAPRRFAPGQEITMSPQELAGIGGFYLDIADGLLAAAWWRSKPRPPEVVIAAE
jgi:hypothetical protein